MTSKRNVQTLLNKDYLLICSIHFVWCDFYFILLFFFFLIYFFLFFFFLFSFFLAWLPKPRESSKIKVKTLICRKYMKATYLCCCSRNARRRAAFNHKGGKKKSKGPRAEKESGRWCEPNIYSRLDFSYFGQRSAWIRVYAQWLLLSWMLQTDTRARTYYSLNFEPIAHNSCSPSCRSLN